MRRRNPNSLSLSSMAKNEGAVVNISKNLQQLKPRLLKKVTKIETMLEFFSLLAHLFYKAIDKKRHIPRGRIPLVFFVVSAKSTPVLSLHSILKTFTLFAWRSFKGQYLK
jgi:hypothetical protein